MMLFVQKILVHSDRHDFAKKMLFTVSIATFDLISLLPTYHIITLVQWHTGVCK